MKRIIIILLLICLSASYDHLCAQGFPIPYQSTCSSAGAATVQFDFDITDSSLAVPSNHHGVICRDQPATTWTQTPMGLLYEACTTYTFSTQINYQPPSGILEWYLRSENDTAVVSQCPKNSGDQFPAPLYLMADMGADSVGDAQGAAGIWLDITHGYAGYSDTKLYFRFDNRGGGFPTNQGLFTYFLYSVGVVDPDATDSVAYALVYGNVPSLLSTGLYKVNPIDSSFTKIGNITTNISGNSLSLSCNISDLTAQPGWSDWPPPSGFIGTAPVTITATLSGMTNNDIGKAGLMIPKTYYLDYSQNNPSTLSGPTASQLGGDTLMVQVTYTDGDNHLPMLRNANIQSINYPMTACAKHYQDGTQFEYRLVVPTSGWYRYYFEFSDGAVTVTSALDSIYMDVPPAYLCGDANGDKTANVSDAVYIINYVFVGGSPAPHPFAAGDANCDGSVNVSDAVWIINYVFAGGHAPCDTNGDGQPDC